ncbi:MAG: SMP-30/gluconolactonase/LRE family protein [Planctomyces sp.]|jgi:gluconolactonase
MFLRRLLLSVLFCTCVSPVHAQAPDGPETLTVITHNVWYGFTKKGEPRHGEWLRWMAAQAPDVVSLQELNGYTAERLASDARAWGHAHSVLLKQDGFPTGITSRYPISDVRILRDGFHHGLLRCRIQGLWFYVIHFHPSNFERRIAEAGLLAADVASLPEADPRILLAGDFNGFSPADRSHYDSDARLVPFFQQLDARNPGAKNLNNGRMDYGGIEAILQQGYVDVLAASRWSSETFAGSFPTPLVSDEDHGTDRRLDYLFASANLAGSVESPVILRDSVTARLSDHYPVRALVRLQRAQAASVFEGAPQLLSETGTGEGPAWHPQLGLLTSGEGNINLRDRSGTVSVYVAEAGSNGLLVDREGRIVVCEPVRRRVSRRTLDGKTTVLAETFGGKKFNQPNDVAVDSKNRLYFTDPRYGSREGMELLDASGRPIEGVYRIDPDGRVVRIIAHEVDRPNGIAISADDRFLFVADNNNNDVGGARKLWRFHLQPDGQPDLATQTLIHDWKTTRGPDGMKFDVEGRLYVAAGLNQPNLPAETAEQPTAGVYVFSPEGRLQEFVRIPRDETTNCGFGGDDGRTLFVTSGGSLWSLRTRVAGRLLISPAR